MTTAASRTNGTSPPPLYSAHPPLSELCATLDVHIAAFLSSSFSDPLLQRTQAQARISLDVVRKALADYRWRPLVSPLTVSPRLANPRAVQHR